MAKIVQKEDSVLREIAKPVDPADIAGGKIQKIIQDMKEALEREPDGVGLAAPQIGIPLRIFIISHRAFEIDEDAEDNLIKKEPPEKVADMIFINPEIVNISRKKRWTAEGCLSVRWLYGNTRRAEKATITAYDENGKKFTRGASGLLAHIFQHEVDHLNGILFIDHAKDIEEIRPEDIEKYHEQ